MLVGLQRWLCSSDTGLQEPHAEVAFSDFVGCGTCERVSTERRGLHVPMSGCGRGVFAVAGSVPAASGGLQAPAHSVVS